MENPNHARVIIATTAFVTFLGIFYLYVFEPFSQEARYLPTGIGDFRDRSSYKIGPETILGALEQEGTNVFTKIPSAGQDQLFEKPISWMQADFIKVAKGMNQFILTEPLTRWQLYSMHFSTVCRDNPSGFSEGDFYYFKTTFRNNGKIRYTTQDFFISPQFQNVSRAGGSSFPHPLIGWKSIKLHNVTITAEGALRIAEKNGGREARALVQDKCQIHVGLTSDAVWQVIVYKDGIGATIFRMKIDAETGKIK